MGRFLYGILAITIASAQPVPILGLGSDNAGYLYFGPKTVYPGFSHYYTFPRTGWAIPVTCAATGNTCNASGSGYPPTGNEMFAIVIGTTMPVGLISMSADGQEGDPVFYKFCNVSGTQFQLGTNNNCGTIATFSSAG